MSLMMTNQERLDKCNQESVYLYLQMQELESTRQQVQMRLQQIQHQLVKLDGKIELLQGLIQEEKVLPMKKEGSNG